jgi:hypothetical protein
MCSRVRSLVVDPAAVGAQVAVAGKQLAVGEAGLERMRVDARNAFGADDAVDVDHRLLAGVRVMAPTEHRDLRARFPADLIGGVVQHGLLQADP